jgi:hypothetical protein
MFALHLEWKQWTNPGKRMSHNREWHISHQTWMLEAPRGHVVIGLREGLPFLGER